MVHKNSIYSQDHSIALYFFSLSRAGGAERMICLLARALTERGYQVSLVTLDSPGTESYYPIASGVRWLQMGFKSGIRDKFRRISFFSQQLTKHKIQILIGFVMSGDKTVYAAAKYSGVKLVVAERNAPAMYWLRYSRLQRWLNFALLHLADAITVQMPNFAVGYPESLHKRINVIPNPVPVAIKTARPDLPNEGGRFQLLAVSRLDYIQKRIGCLIGAFALIAREYPEWDLRIIGDGPEGDTLRCIIAENALVDRVRIEPARADIFDVYAQAHLFVIPSLWEGFPNALAEALCHGLPAVGFAGAAGVSDLIGDTAGWLAAGLDDEAALAQTLAQAIVDGQGRALRGSQAVQNMAVFEPKEQYERWLKLFSKLVED